MKNVLILLMVISSIKAFSQVGIGTVSPHVGSILELSSANQGFLLTRVSLANTTTWGLSGTSIEGMKVYNTNTSIVGTALAPKLKTGKGVYYWSNSKWVPVGEVDIPVKIVGVDGIGCSLSSPNNFTSAVVDATDAANGGVLADVNTIYINKCDGSSWTYNASSNNYITYNSISGTPFNVLNTSLDVGGNKFKPIIRLGNVYSGTEIGKSVALINNQSTESSISFFNRSVTPNKNYSFRANTTYRPDFFDFVSSGAPATIASGIMMAFNRNTGKVGFNNEFPDDRLDVWSNSGEGSGLRIGQYGVGSFRITMPASQNKLNIGIANSPIMTFSDQQQVGIKTTVPQGVLHVDGAKDNPSSGAPTMVQALNDFVVLDNGRVGIGTTTPLGSIHVVSSSSTVLDRYGNTPSRLLLRSANGTVDSPVQRFSNQPISELIFSAYDGSVFNDSAGIICYSTEDTTPTAGGSNMNFFTTPNGTSSPIRRFVIEESGNIGIGTGAPATQRLQVVGNILASGTILSSSDVRLKSNITEIDKVLELLIKTRPVSYDKRLALDPKIEGSVYENGFIAQELQKLFPSLVTENKDEYKTLSVNYISMIPILVKSIQEQQEIINILIQRVKILEDKK